MKILFLFILLSLLSCQKNETKPSPANQPEKVLSIEDEIGSFTFVSSVSGIEIKGDRISRQGEMTTGEDLKIIEKSSSEIIDEFPMKDWGMVGFKVDQEIVHLYPLKDFFEIIYSIKEKKVIRKSVCHFKSVPEKSRYDSLIAQAKEVNPDWETIVSALSDLARSGDKRSYDFFMKPDADGSGILKNTEDGGASISKVLRYMAQNGCKW